MNLSYIYETILNCHGFLAYHYGKGLAFPPLRIQLEVTGACNLKCEFCCQDDRYKQGKGELSLSEIKSLIDQIPRFSLLTFSGGEPLFRKDVTQIIGYALKKKHFCNISTNGVLLDRENIELLSSKGFLIVSVSLDGIGEIHDKMRGVPQTFERVRNNLINFSAFRKENRKKLPLLDIKAVITDKNIDELSRLYAFCEEINADFITLSLLKSNDAQFNPSLLRGDINDRLFYSSGISNDIDKQKLINELERLENLKGRTKIRFYPRFRSLRELRSFLVNGFDSLAKAVPCMEPWSSFQVNAFGQVYPCLAYKAGDIRTESLKQIWRSPRYVAFRKKLKKLRHFPACEGCCYLKVRV